MIFKNACQINLYHPWNIHVIKTSVSSKSRMLTLRVSIIYYNSLFYYCLLDLFNEFLPIRRWCACSEVHLSRSLFVAVMEIKLCGFFFFSHSPLRRILKIDRFECDCGCCERMSFKLCFDSIGSSPPSKHVQHNIVY